MNTSSETTEKPKVKGPTLVEEILDYWRKWPHKALFLSALAIWVLFFHFLGNSTLGYTNTRSLFGWLDYVYHATQDDEHGLLIPFVVVILCWWKREELLPAARDCWWPSLGFVVFGLVAHVLGYAIQQTRLSVIGFFVGFYGLTGLVWGKQWLLKSFFPMVMFVFCVPLNAISDVITQPLRTAVAAISVGIGHHALGIDVFRSGSQIVNGKGVAMYDVAPACSGIRSLVTLLAITMVYGFLNFKRVWKRGIIILSGFPLAVLGNVARITTVIIVGEVFGKEKAVMIEQKFGFITFAVAVGSVLAIGYFLREDKRKPGKHEALPLDAKTA